MVAVLGNERCWLYPEISEQADTDIRCNSVKSFLPNASQVNQPYHSICCHFLFFQLPHWIIHGPHWYHLFLRFDAMDTIVVCVDTYL